MDQDRQQGDLAYQPRASMAGTERAAGEQLQSDGSGRTLKLILSISPKTTPKVLTFVVLFLALASVAGNFSRDLLPRDDRLVKIEALFAFSL